MRSLFNRFDLRYVWWALAVAFIVKVVWFLVEIVWLHFVDIDYMKKATKKPLFYTSHFALSIPPQIKKPKPQTIRQNNEIKQMKLVSIYHGKDNDVATIVYHGKTKVIARGEKIGGYTLKSGGIDFALFDRDGKTYTLYIKKDKNKSKIEKYIKEELKPKQNKESLPKEGDADEEIIFDGTKRIVPREVLTKYTKDIKAVYRNIGMEEVRKKGKVEGFRVTFIRRNSIFAKLGLRRGDIITSVNGRPLDGLQAAFETYRSANDAVDMNFKIKRENKTMELKYEID